MPKFVVTVIKTEVHTVDIEVEAETLAHAEDKAEEQARDRVQDWSYEESEFMTYGEEIYETA